MLSGHFAHDPFRSYFLAETSLMSWTFRPKKILTKKGGHFGQNILDRTGYYLSVNKRHYVAIRKVN